MKSLPSSYRYELIHLCWYCRGKGFFPFRLFSCCITSENNWRPASGRRQYRSLGRDMICYFTNTWLRVIQISSVFSICINGRETYWFFSCLQVLFSSTNIDCIRHINTFFYQIHKSRHSYKFLHINQHGKSLFVMIRILS